MRQGWGGPLNSHREALTARSLAKEAASRPSSGWKRKERSQPRATREQRGALHGPASSLSSQAQARGATSNRGTTGDRRPHAHPCSALRVLSGVPAGPPAQPQGPDPDPRAITSRTPLTLCSPCPWSLPALDQSPQWSSSERGLAPRRGPQRRPRNSRKRLWPERDPVPVLLLTENINVYILARNPQDFLSRSAQARHWAGRDQLMSDRCLERDTEETPRVRTPARLEHPDQSLSTWQRGPELIKSNSGASDFLPAEPPKSRAP